jgi:hypothetical protein
MQDWFDGTLYPDVDPPAVVDALEERIDFLARLCAAWDFGVLPYMATIREVRHPAWREAVDACNLLTSPTYHLLRQWHNLPALPYLGQKLGYIRDDPNLQYI